MPSEPEIARSPALALLLALTPVLGAQEAAPSLEVTGSGRTDGHATLAWSAAPRGAAADLEFELQSSAAPDFDPFERCYLGTDRASFRSGLPAGTHHFRVRQRPAGEPEAWSPWSEPVAVEIRPYPLATAWMLFGLGALLVGSIVVFLIGANRRAQHDPGLHGEVQA